ncbi:MAG: hypothetical protein FD138_3160, partial [Planctomycetota bacterium]
CPTDIPRTIDSQRPSRVFRTLGFPVTERQGYF